jgi:hypothetical protein
VSHHESDGWRFVVVRVLIFTALVLAPGKLPYPEGLTEAPHAIVQPLGRPVAGLHESVASLASGR